jgi:Acyl-CoA dehydrogenase, C-terminal domain
MDPRCAFFILMGRTDPSAPAHRQQTMVLVPCDTPGVTVVRDYPALGHYDQHGHAEVLFRDVRVPATSVIGEEGGGSAAAQARLGPGRIHHCMRALGAAERALALLVQRARERVAFGARSQKPNWAGPRSCHWGISRPSALAAGRLGEVLLPGLILSEQHLRRLADAAHALTTGGQPRPTCWLAAGTTSRQPWAACAPVVVLAQWPVAARADTPLELQK